MKHINNNKIVFSSFHGTQYSDSPRYISECLLNIAESENMDLDVVWITNGSFELPSNVRAVIQGTRDAIYEMATAKVWVDNTRKELWDRKRNNQYYVQTWHGGTALKKIEKDALDKLSKGYVKRAILDSKMSNAFISCSKWNTELYRRAFWYNGDIYEFGAPRSDIFYKDETVFRNRAMSFFKLKGDEHCVLYAPTFRNKSCINCYDIQFEKLLNHLKKCWGGDWKIIIRLHPNIANMETSFTYDDNVLNGSFYPDINELIIASDLVITDYSSCMFDAMEAGKRVILYASDLDEYLDERGLYFDLKELPFPLSTNNSELLSIIKNFNTNKYKKNVAAFIESLGLFNDGKASEKCARLLLNILDH